MTEDRKNEFINRCINQLGVSATEAESLLAEFLNVLGGGSLSEVKVPNGKGKCVIRLVSVETVGDVESWGHDIHYHHDLVVEIEENIEDREKYVLEKISRGDFTLEGDPIWCTELEKPLSRDSIMNTSSSVSSLDKFSDSVMEDMYNSLLDWCRSKWPNAKERSIYLIARAIEEPMFGGESMDSQAYIDFIED
jgi:hypothetical protein